MSAIAGRQMKVKVAQMRLVARFATRVAIAMLMLSGTQCSSNSSSSLNPFASEKTPQQQALDSRGEGLHHVCFVVDDLDAAIEAVEDAIVSPAYLSGRATRVCFLAGRTHGVTIELTESTR